MSTPNRMARYEIRNDGSGPYAVFFCEQCGREFPSRPFTVASAVAARGKELASDALDDIPIVGEVLAAGISQADLDLGAVEERGREALSNLLSGIPILGEALAAGVTASGARHVALTPQQLQAAWEQVEPQFRQCATCGQVVCETDFDESSGLCAEHSPQRSAASAQPTGYGYPSVQSAAEPAPYGYESVQSAAEPAPYGYEGPSPAAPPTPAAGAACPSCGEALSGAAKFCPSCGAKLEPPKPKGVCPNCGTEAPGAKFCPNCGTKMG